MKCTKCKLEKDPTEFYKSKKTYCKECWLKKCKEFRLNNPEKIKQTNRQQYLNKRQERIKAAREYVLKNPERQKINKQKRLEKNPRYYKAIDLKSKYGLTLEQYDKLIELQNNKCAICLEVFNKGYPYVDHCHTTGKTRGILCMGCNTSLGLLKENVKVLKRMINYIFLHKPLQSKMKL